MNRQATPTPEQQSSYRCPICGNSVPYEPALPRFDAPCSECGYHLWCRERTPGDDVTELEVLPQRTPEPWDVDQLVKALVARNAHRHVVVNLSRLDMIDSAFVARLVSLNKLVHAAGGRFVLQGLCPLIQETFAHLRLDQAFEMKLDR